MIIRLFLLLLVGLPSWYFSNMDSPSRFLAYVLPIITFICFLLFCLWVIRWFEQIKIHSKSE